MSRPNLTLFRNAVYERVAAIPHGKVVTYADISAPARSRVGGAMEHLVRHFEPELPWYRVVNSDGSLSDKTMDGQRGLLQAEGVGFLSDERVDFRRCLWKQPSFEPIE